VQERRVRWSRVLRQEKNSERAYILTVKKNA
jgi:hypothetical protein